MKYIPRKYFVVSCAVFAFAKHIWNLNNNFFLCNSQQLFTHWNQLNSFMFQKMATENSVERVILERKEMTICTNKIWNCLQITQPVDVTMQKQINIYITLGIMSTANIQVNGCHLAETRAMRSFRLDGFLGALRSSSTPREDASSRQKIVMERKYVFENSF